MLIEVGDYKGMMIIIMQVILLSSDPAQTLKPTQQTKTQKIK